MIMIAWNKNYKKNLCDIFLQSHSSVERAALLGAVKIRLLPADKDLSLRGETVAKAIQEDRKKGYIPFLVSQM